MNVDTSGGRKRILFVAEAVTLAHVARAYTLAKLLPVDRYDVKVVCDPRYQFLFASEPVEHGQIDSIPTAQFEDALNRGAPLYQFATLLDYAEADSRAIEAFRPDVVIGDFRLSLGVSARLAGTPYINVTNAGWSPYARPRFVVPDIALVRRVGPTIAQFLFDLARPISFRLHAQPMNRLRRHYGLPPLSPDLRHAYTDGDFTLYADLPELIPMHGAPSSHAFLGPVQWSPRPPSPPWAEQVPTDRPLAYVALGSSGRRAILPTIVDALADNGWTVVAATAGRAEVATPRSGVFIADFLDGDLWASRARLVVCNGGSPTCYQALSHGVPLLGLPSNLDQYLNMAAVEDAGAGILLRSGRITRATVAAAADLILTGTSPAAAARRLANAIARSDPARVLVGTCERAIAGARRTTVASH